MAPRAASRGRGPDARRARPRGAPNPGYVQVLYDEAMLNDAASPRPGSPRDPPGGTVERDADGAATGIVRGSGAFRHCLAAMGRPGRAAQAQSIRTMLRELAALGLIGALDPGGIGVVPDDLPAALRRVAGGRADAADAPVPRRRRARLPSAAQLEDWMERAPRGSGDEMLRVTGIGEIVVFRCWDGDGLAPIEIDARQPPRVQGAQRDGRRGRLADARPRDPRRERRARSSTRGRRSTGRTRSAACASGSRTPRGSAIGRWRAPRARPRPGAAGPHADARIGSVAGWGEPAVEQAPPLRRMIELGFPLGAGTDATVVSSINPWRRCGGSSAGRTLGGPRRAAEHRLTRAQALGPLHARQRVVLLGGARARRAVEAGALGGPRSARRRLLRHRRGCAAGRALGADGRRRRRRACRRRRSPARASGH